MTTIECMKRLLVSTSLLLLGLVACRCSPNPDRSDPVRVPTAATAAVASAPAPAVSAPVVDATAPLKNDACPAALADTRRDGARAGAFTAPTDAERGAIKRAVARLLAGDKNVDTAAFGFETATIAEWPGTLLLRERDGQRRGGGAYVVRVGTASSLVVQAPHTFYDEGTFPLACAFFAQTGARMLAINTAHRYKAAPVVGDLHPADVAHAPNTLFQGVTEGAIEALKERITLVQLHGFANREVDAQAVVSSGDRRADAALVARVAAKLEAITQPRILRFPLDTKELGATTNIQGPLVRAAGGHFIHVEMSDDLRRELARDSDFRNRAFAALFDALSPP